MPFLHFPANLDFARPSDNFGVVVGFHQPWNTQETIKSVTVNTKNNTCETVTFWENVQKLTSTWLPNCELISGKITLGRPGWPIFILSGKSAPHVLQKWSERKKNGAKRDPECAQKCKSVYRRMWKHKDVYMAQRIDRSGGRGLADCAKRLQFLELIPY